MALGFKPTRKEILELVRAKINGTIEAQAKALYDQAAAILQKHETTVKAFQDGLAKEAMKSPALKELKKLAKGCGVELRHDMNRNGGKWNYTFYVATPRVTVSVEGEKPVMSAEDQKEYDRLRNESQQVQSKRVREMDALIHHLVNLNAEAQAEVDAMAQKLVELIFAKSVAVANGD